MQIQKLAFSECVRHC